MVGVVTNIPKDKVTGQLRDFCFIENLEQPKAAFLHISNFLGDWKELVARVTSGEMVRIEFKLEDSKKGPRAINATYA